MIITGSDEVVKRYVKALQNLAFEEKKENKIKKDLSLVDELVKKNKEFKKIIFSPIVSPKKHQEILKLVSKSLKMDQITENFFIFISIQ